MKTIISAIDFSPVSINAARYAADLSVAINAKLLLVNVVQLPVSVSEVPVSGYGVDEMVKDSETELYRLKDELSRFANNEIEVDVSTSVGSVSYVLREEANQRKAFAIVMGTDTTRGIEHLFKEDHTLAAIHGISTPVLVIPENAAFRKIRKVVLATDLREPKKIAPLTKLREWLKVFQPQVDIVCVVKSSQLKSESVAGPITFQHEFEDFRRKFHFLYEDKVKEGVQEYVEQSRPDLLVIMPGSYGFFSRLFHKSQSKQLIDHPHLPVLSILD